MTSDFYGVEETLATNLAYRAFGPQTGVELGNGLSVSNDFDLRYRLKNSTAGSLYDRDYGYYNTGHVQSITDNIDNSRSQSFVYDPDRYWLKEATGIYGHIVYDVDKVGNRLSKTVDSAVTNYSYVPDTNQLDEEQEPGGTTAYDYDVAGNPKTIGDKSLTWNDNNRLVDIEVGGSSIGSYGYDSNGLRVIKTTPNGTSYSIYSQSGDLLVETDDQGRALQEYIYLSGQRISMFVYLTDDTSLVNAVKTLKLLSGSTDVTVNMDQDISGNSIVEMEDALLHMQDQYDQSGPSVYYYINDHLSTGELVVDKDGQVVWQCDFRPFGEVDMVVNQVENRFRFPGQILDEESGLYYNWNRFYDPATGRYINADPIGLAGG